ncbi:MAG: hypothetical protein LBD24_02570 [Spirochaetaceae bacterium]|nr:hypothetical protein [Spirochaetaceae bacterium]
METRNSVTEFRPSAALGRPSALEFRPSAALGRPSVAEFRPPETEFPPPKTGSSVPKTGPPLPKAKPPTAKAEGAVSPIETPPPESGLRVLTAASQEAYETVEDGPRLGSKQPAHRTGCCTNLKQQAAMLKPSETVDRGGGVS